MRCNIRYSAAKLSPKRAWVRNPSNSALTGDSSDMKLETTDKRAEDNNKCQKTCCSSPSSLYINLTFHYSLMKKNGYSKAL